MSQTVTTTTHGSFFPAGLQCVTGRFNLLFFIQNQAQIFPPPAGGVIGQIQPLTGGSPIPVIQTQPSNIPLSLVDNRIVTLCGFFVVRGGQVVLDARLVLRVFPFFPFGKGFGKGLGQGLGPSLGPGLGLGLAPGLGQGIAKGFGKGSLSPMDVAALRARGAGTPGGL